ncbi:LysR family transcriptional regulator [Enterobacteriaceae bacterium H11S18]|uniref:LysR family transcriptional regulator n=1 Tax=Dryocola clanedunensis TaxID=2925396 RepID=UPI0022F02063|nr:LysR family transcriptional regulator [Dryocola clanedunensis]MCT4712787.1 LysR family transcriptional regulator [Dryocola clanedunensis]
MIDSIDIKVLRAVYLLMTCKSVKKTAQLLDVTPGAVSYLLNKARKETGSVLFLRTKAGMIPNDIANELGQRYLSLSRHLSDSHQTDSSSDRKISICTDSIVEFLISKKVSERKNYPRQISFLPSEMEDENRLLGLHCKKVDIDAGTRLPPDSDIVQSLLFTGGMKILMAKDNPLANDEFTLKQWTTCRHVHWSRKINYLYDDKKQARRFNDLMDKRKVRVVSGDSLNMVMACAFSDHIILMPESLSRLIVKRLPMIEHSPPPELNMHVSYYLHYNHNAANDEQLQDIMRTLRNIFKPDE